MKDEIIYYCPYCKDNISEMSVKDSIGHLIKQGEIGTIYFYRCPYCKRIFSDLDIEIEKLTKDENNDII